jgi:hypothetical protein
MATVEKIVTHQKTLNIHLDLAMFGSFAEIGAGQEVVRSFLHVREDSLQISENRSEAGDSK